MHGFLIYSYFFLWTAALAWLVTLFALLALSGYRRELRVFAVVGAITIVGLVPYRMGSNAATSCHVRCDRELGSVCAVGCENN